MLHGIPVLVKDVGVTVVQGECSLMSIEYGDKGQDANNSRFLGLVR